MTWGGVTKPPVMPSGVKVVGSGPPPLGLLERDISVATNNEPSMIPRLQQFSVQQATDDGVLGQIL